jgi:hypothetical protein
MYVKLETKYTLFITMILIKKINVVTKIIVKINVAMKDGHSLLTD